VLRLKFLDVFVEAGFVGYMAAGELQYALATQGMLERLLTDGALAADEGPLAASP
jgi:hypothetical protein